MPEGIVLASSNEADLDLFDPSPRMTRAFCALAGTVEVEREEVSSVPSPGYFVLRTTSERHLTPEVYSVL